jgi:gluconolactonase
MGDVQPLEILDPRVLELVAADAKVRHHGGDGVWTEGPVYLPTSDSVIWSDIPNNRIMRWHDGHITTWRQPSNFTNGHTLDHEGRIIHCSHGARAMLRTEHDGTVTTLIDRFEGRRFNSPNDVVVARDGSIWFTDPPYGILSNKEGYKADSEQPGCYVYRLVPTTGEVTVMVTDLIRPNGLAFSPDESLLYVSDTSQGDFGDSGLPHIYVYDVDHGVGGAVGVSATNGRGFCRVREGLHLQRHGNRDLLARRHPPRPHPRPREGLQLLLGRPHPSHPLHHRHQRPLQHRPPGHPPPLSHQCRAAKRTVLRIASPVRRQPVQLGP